MLIPMHLQASLLGFSSHVVCCMECQQLNPSVCRPEVVKQLCPTQETKLAMLECLIHLHFSFLSSPSASLITSDVRLKASADHSKLPPEVVNETLVCVLSLVKASEVDAALDLCWTHRLVGLSDVHSFHCSHRLFVK